MVGSGSKQLVFLAHSAETRPQFLYLQMLMVHVVLELDHQPFGFWVLGGHSGELMDYVMQGTVSS